MPEVWAGVRPPTQRLALLLPLLLRLRYSNPRGLCSSAFGIDCGPVTANTNQIGPAKPIGILSSLGRFLLLFALRAFSLLPFGRFLAPDLRRGLGCLRSNFLTTLRTESRRVLRVSMSVNACFCQLRFRLLTPKR